MVKAELEELLWEELLEELWEELLAEEELELVIKTWYAWPGTP